MYTTHTLALVPKYNLLTLVLWKSIKKLKHTLFFFGGTSEDKPCPWKGDGDEDKWLSNGDLCWKIAQSNIYPIGTVKNTASIFLQR